MAIEEMEARAVSLLVQKFLEALPKISVPSAADQAMQRKAAAERKVAEIIAKRNTQEAEIRREEEEILAGAGLER
jgi:hypothetical protein